MKRYGEKKLYETTIKKLLATRFYKGETPYIFAYYIYVKGVYNFVFVEEKDKNKAPLYVGAKCICNVMYWQQTNDYADTYKMNCNSFDKCEPLTA